MEQTFLVRVTVSGLKKELNLSKKEAITKLIKFWITDVGDGFYDYIIDIVRQLVDDVNIKLEVVDED